MTKRYEIRRLKTAIEAGDMAMFLEVFKQVDIALSPFWYNLNPDFVSDLISNHLDRLVIVEDEFLEHMFLHVLSSNSSFKEVIYKSGPYNLAFDFINKLTPPPRGLILNAHNGLDEKIEFFLNGLTSINRLTIYAPGEDLSNLLSSLASSSFITILIESGRVDRCVLRRYQQSSIEIVVAPEVLCT